MAVWHLTYAADGRHALFPHEDVRLMAVLRLAGVAGAYMVGFCIVDEHVHVAVTASAARSGHLARTILLAIRPFAAARLDPAHLRPVATRRHLEWLVRRTIDRRILRVVRMRLALRQRVMGSPSHRGALALTHQTG